MSSNIPAYTALTRIYLDDGVSASHQQIRATRAATTATVWSLEEKMKRTLKRCLSPHTRPGCRPALYLCRELCGQVLITVTYRFGLRLQNSLCKKIK